MFKKHIEYKVKQQQPLYNRLVIAYNSDCSKQSNPQEFTQCCELLREILPETLILFALYNAKFSRLCKHAKLDEYWKNYLTQCEFDNHGQMHQAIPREDAKILLFHQAVATYFEKEYLILYAKDPSHELLDCYLEKAKDYQSFPATKALINGDLYRLGEPQITDKILFANSIFTQTIKLADLHWAAGYIFLAQTCKTLGDYFKNRANNLGLANEYYKISLRALWIANLIETNPNSKKASKNAYYGSYEISGPTFWKKQFSTHADEFKLSDKEQLLKTEAEEIVNKHIIPTQNTLTTHFLGNKV